MVGVGGHADHIDLEVLLFKEVLKVFAMWRDLKVLDSQGSSQVKGKALQV